MNVAPGRAAVSRALAELARYNRWANAKVFAACANADAEGLERVAGYESPLGILRHLVQVQLNFLRMSQGQARQRTDETGLAALAERCAAVDAEYVSIVDTLSPQDLARTFHVPWFGFDVTVEEAMLQALTHSQKHRADVCLALPSLRVEAPQIDYIQMLDEERGEPSS